MHCADACFLYSALSEPIGVDNWYRYSGCMRQSNVCESTHKAMLAGQGLFRVSGQ